MQRIIFLSSGKCGENLSTEELATWVQVIYTMHRWFVIAWAWWNRIHKSVGCLLLDDVVHEIPSNVTIRVSWRMERVKSRSPSLVKSLPPTQ